MLHTTYLCLTRGDEDLDDIEVQFELSRRDETINLISVRWLGAELITTQAEDEWIVDRLFDNFSEYIMDEESAYADYRYEQMKDDRDA